MNQQGPTGIYERIGTDGIARVVADFYRRVPDDPILGPMYPQHDLAGAEARLCGFLVFRLGGPAGYVEQRGHPRLRMRHAPFAIDRRARDRWMELMVAAIEAAEWPGEVVDELVPLLDQIATFLINRSD